MPKGNKKEKRTLSTVKRVISPEDWKRQQTRSENVAVKVRRLISPEDWIQRQLNGQKRAARRLPKAKIDALPEETDAGRENRMIENLRGLKAMKGKAPSPDLRAEL